MTDHLGYGTEISTDLSSRVTDAVVDEVQSWQPRPLGAALPIVFLDALVIKVVKGTARPERERAGATFQSSAAAR